MAFYQPKASELVGHLIDFRARVRQREYDQAATSARYAEYLLEDFEKWRKKHKKIVDLWESDPPTAA